MTFFCPGCGAKVLLLPKDWESKLCEGCLEDDGDKE